MKPGFLLTMMVLLVEALSFAFLGCGPQIDDIDPSLAREGMPVDILGADFGAVQEDSTVTFGGVDAGEAVSWSESKIGINVPYGAASGNGVVTVNGKLSNEYPFYVPDLVTCEAFSGGDFDLAIHEFGGNCFSNRWATIASNVLKNIDLSSLNPVNLPATSALPIEGFELELPFVGPIGYGVDPGVNHCAEGAGGAPVPVIIDFDYLTAGTVPCVVAIETMISFTMDPIYEDTAMLTLMMQVASIEGEECPITTEGCTLALEIWAERPEAP